VSQIVIDLSEPGVEIGAPSAGARVVRADLGGRKGTENEENR
jgi:hypothetical protein